MLKHADKAVLIAVLTGLVLTGNAMAETKFERNHPRRDQVNDRLQKQNHRINHELKEGDISRQQARRMHNEDHHIRHEEQRMAAQNGGAITRQEQGRLNQQENRVSAQIGR
jgi:hypothetical protein